MEATRWLGHATRLAGTGAGRPPIVDLRRGVSAAYYALYHGLTGHAAAHALPGLPTEHLQQGRHDADYDRSPGSREANERLHTEEDEERHRGSCEAASTGIRVHPQAAG
jgi:hypothetical protein